MVQDNKRTETRFLRSVLEECARCLASVERTDHIHTAFNESGGGNLSQTQLRSRKTGSCTGMFLSVSVAFDRVQSETHTLFCKSSNVWRVCLTMCIEA
jgi:hypothetical protein